MKNHQVKFKNSGHSYSILIGDKTLNFLPEKIKSLCPQTKKIALIIDRIRCKRVEIAFKLSMITAKV